jgi:hypothetical protein
MEQNPPIVGSVEKEKCDIYILKNNALTILSQKMKQLPFQLNLG